MNNSFRNVLRTQPVIQVYHSDSPTCMSSWRRDDTHFHCIGFSSETRFDVLYRRTVYTHSDFILFLGNNSIKISFIEKNDNGKYRKRFFSVKR